LSISERCKRAVPTIDGAAGGTADGGHAAQVRGFANPTVIEIERNKL
jgi:hypothetical protein